MTLCVGSLFSGIGGIDLGLERAGMRVVWQCESDEWCRGILAQHWPGVPCYPDVRSLVAGADSEPLEWPPVARPQLPDGRGPLPVPVPPVDVLAGGFPCQPVSGAGKRLGQEDERWLWPDFADCIRLLRPRFVVVENVPGLLAPLRERKTRRLLSPAPVGEVLGDLATFGFDAEWAVFGARDVGAPHRRDRVWIIAWDRVAHPQRLELRDEPGRRGWAGGKGAPESRHDGPQGDVAHANSGGRNGRAGDEWPAGWREPTNGSHPASDACGSRPQGDGVRRPTWHCDPWPPEPGVGRVAHGVPRRVDRLRGLGNAVVPACAEHIGRLVMEMAA